MNCRTNAWACGKPAGSRPPFAFRYATTGVPDTFFSFLWVILVAAMCPDLAGSEALRTVKASELQYVEAQPGDPLDDAVFWPIPLTDHAPEDVQVDVRFRGTVQRFGQVCYGTPNSRPVVIVVDEIDRDRFELYVDATRSRRVTENDRVPGEGRLRRTTLTAEVAREGQSPQHDARGGVSPRCPGHSDRFRHHGPTGRRDHAGRTLRQGPPHRRGRQRPVFRRPGPRVDRPGLRRPVGSVFGAIPLPAHSAPGRTPLCPAVECGRHRVLDGRNRRLRRGQAATRHAAAGRAASRV